jgi:hypothetical protein
MIALLMIVAGLLALVAIGAVIGGLMVWQPTRPR